VLFGGFLLGPPALGLLGNGEIEVVVLDVGQGDATLLRSPAGRWIMVDTGPKTRSFDAGERTILPFLRRRGVKRLDLMILTHPDMDHVGGAAAVLQGFPVAGVLDPGVPAGTEAFLSALGSASDRGLPWHVAQVGDSIHLDGVAVRVLAPENPDGGHGGEGANASSLVLEVRYGEFSMLLTGDAPAEEEIRFLPRLLSARIHVLKVGHHGSATSTSTELVDRTDPGVALISAGRRNRFGHPHPEVLARLSEAGARIFRTDIHGTVTVRGKKNGTYSVSPQLQ
ncbi:MAG: MBL fold metallo-hydrolase, partial [Gemmatimonadetes bacterium]|nr:MBL fold metallo-hydrolase [Gemmatimonadota bacterium]